MELKLKKYERVWLEKYRQALDEQYPDLVEEVLVFSRRDSNVQIPEYTVNVVVILKEGDWQTHNDVRFPGPPGRRGVPGHSPYLGLYQRGVAASASRRNCCLTGKQLTWR